MSEEWFVTKNLDTDGDEPLWKGRPVSNGHPLRKWELDCHVADIDRRGRFTRGWFFPQSHWHAYRDLNGLLVLAIKVPFRFVISRKYGRGHGLANDYVVRSKDGFIAKDMELFEAEYESAIE